MRIPQLSGHLWCASVGLHLHVSVLPKASVTLSDSASKLVCICISVMYVLFFLAVHYHRVMTAELKTLLRSCLFRSLECCFVGLPVKLSEVGCFIFKQGGKNMCVRGERVKMLKGGGMDWIRGIEESKVNDRMEKKERQLRISTLSSQLLWFRLADSTQSSQHLTAVRHAYSVLFLTWTPKLGS